MKGLVQEYLKNMREIFTSLSYDTGSSFFSPYSSIPLLFIVFIVATASSIITCIMGAAFTIIVTLIIHRKLHEFHYVYNIDYDTALRTILIISIMVLVVSVPATIIYGIDAVNMFIIRTLSSSIIFVLMLRIIGWWNLIRGLELIKTPRIIIEMVYQTVKFIPLFLSETLKLLMAREARVLGKTNTHHIWGSLSSIVAELMVKAYHKSAMLNMALSARTLSEGKPCLHRIKDPTMYDVLLITVSGALLVYEVVYRVWSGLL